jgi:hypothetical protein
MKRIFTCLIGAALLLSLASRVACADPIAPAFPPTPKRPAGPQRDDRSVPLYAVSAGVVAMALTGSFVALRIIRKRNGG